MRKGFQRLDSLPEDKMAEIDRLLALGTPASKVARIMQQDWKLLTDVKYSTARRMLGSYLLTKKSVTTKLVLSGAMNKGHVHEQIDCLLEMEKLVRDQITRRGIAKELELKTNGMLTTMVGDESDRLLEYLKMLLDKYQEFGLSPKIRKKVNAAFRVIENERGRRVAAFEVNEEQIAAIEGIKKLYEPGSKPN